MYGLVTCSVITIQSTALYGSGEYSHLLSSLFSPPWILSRFPPLSRLFEDAVIAHFRLFFPFSYHTLGWERVVSAAAPLPVPKSSVSVR